MKPWDQELFKEVRSELAIVGPAAGIPEALKEFEDEQGIIHQPVFRRASYLMNHWTHINLARSKRVMHVKEPSMENPGHCFFCKGGEDQTPRHAATHGDFLRIPDSPDWQLRCFNNLFPWMEEHLNIVETPQHKISLKDMVFDEELMVFKTASKVIQDVEERNLYPLFFRNQGYGASISHYHWQIGALPEMPALIREELTKAEQFFARYQVNLFDAIIQSELEKNERIVLDHTDYAVMMTYAPRTRFETLIIPKFQLGSLSEASDVQLRSITSALYETLRLLFREMGIDTMNIIVHQLKGNPNYRFHIEIMPHKFYAGAELGFREFAVEVTPENAALELKKNTRKSS